jgi:hypothetical protein
MTSSIWAPYATATLNGVQIDTALVIGARVETSFADPVSKGYVRCVSAPSWGQGDSVTIALGGGANNVTCFHGTVYEGDYLNSGPHFELICRGPLYAVQKYRNNRAQGLTLSDLTGGAATDENIAKAVLDIVGVDYNSSHIGGTGIIRGATAPDGYTWRKGETALDYLQRLTKASLGYKIVESTDGSIYRTQVLGDPAGLPADFSFVEGVDIFEGAHTQRETFDTFNAWEVTGFDYGDGLGAVTFRSPDPIPDGTIPYAFSSEMIERDTEDDPRSGISCEAVLDYVRGDSDHELVKLSGLQTPRDELIGPGNVISINSPMLGTSQSLWCLSVTRESDADWFIQTLELLA